MVDGQARPPLSSPPATSVTMPHLPRRGTSLSPSPLKTCQDGIHCKIDIIVHCTSQILRQSISSLFWIRLLKRQSCRFPLFRRLLGCLLFFPCSSFFFVIHFRFGNSKTNPSSIQKTFPFSIHPSFSHDLHASCCSRENCPCPFPRVPCSTESRPPATTARLRDKSTFWKRLPAVKNATANCARHGCKG